MNFLGIFAGFRGFCYPCRSSVKHSTLLVFLTATKDIDMKRTLICLGMVHALVATSQMVLKSGTTAATTTNANSLFTNGKVAIGGLANGTLPTTDPALQLQVTGSTKLSNNATGSETLQFQHYYSPGGSTLPATAGQLFGSGNIQFSGSYGAGAANPWSATYGYTGHAMSFGTAGLSFLYGPSNVNNPRLGFSSSSATAQRFAIQSAGSLNSLVLNTNGMDRLTISPSGNVGIGVDNPGVALDVAGGSHRIGNLGLYSDGGATSLSLNGSPDYYGGSDWGNASRNAGWFGKLAFASGDGSFRFVSSGAATTAGQFVPNTAMRTHMVLGGDGRLGLGTTSPENTLHVNVQGSAARFDVAKGPGATNPDRIYLGGDRLAITFQPWQGQGNSWMHIHHTLGDALQISNGNVPGQNALATFRGNGQVIIGSKVPSSNAYNDQDAKLMVVGKIVPGRS